MQKTRTFLNDHFPILYFFSPRFQAPCACALRPTHLITHMGIFYMSRKHHPRTKFKSIFGVRLNQGLLGIPLRLLALTKLPVLSNHYRCVLGFRAIRSEELPPRGKNMFIKNQKATRRVEGKRAWISLVPGNH